MDYLNSTPGSNLCFTCGSTCIPHLDLPWLYTEIFLDSKSESLPALIYLYTTSGSSLITHLYLLGFQHCYSILGGTEIPQDLPEFHFLIYLESLHWFTWLPHMDLPELYMCIYLVSTPVWSLSVFWIYVICTHGSIWIAHLDSPGFYIRVYIECKHGFT